MTEMDPGSPAPNYVPLPPLKTGLAVAALVCGIVGMCVPLVGVIGLILGIIALTRANSKPLEFGGKGMAIGGIAVGGASILVSCLMSLMMMGILLPALGKARSAARQIKSGVQVRAISQALFMYAGENQDAFPEAGADLTKRLSKWIDPSIWNSPSSIPGEPSYLYVPGQSPDFDATKVLVFENPVLMRGGTNIGYCDGSVTFLTPPDWMQVIPNLKNVTTDTGKPWTYVAPR